MLLSFGLPARIFFWLLTSLAVVLFAGRKKLLTAGDCAHSLMRYKIVRNHTIAACPFQKGRRPRSVGDHS